VKLRRVNKYFKEVVVKILLSTSGLRNEKILGQPSLSIPIDISLIKRGCPHMYLVQSRRTLFRYFIVYRVP
jgi:hypothetical protein